jgi:hypothetical protein
MAIPSLFSFVVAARLLLPVAVLVRMVVGRVAAAIDDSAESPRSSGGRRGHRWVDPGGGLLH